MGVADDLILENADVIWRNFAGREKPFNQAGDRNFCINLDTDLAMRLKEKGWNIKQHKIREEGEDPRYYTQVAVKYDKRPPKVVLITARGRLELGEDDLSTLDWADVENWDVVVNPYQWNVNGETGIKGYLKMIFVKLNENVFELKYSDLDDLNPTMTMDIPSTTVSEEAA